MGKREHNKNVAFDKKNEHSCNGGHRWREWESGTDVIFIRNTENWFSKYKMIHQITYSKKWVNKPQEAEKTTTRKVITKPQRMKYRE